jgi:acyl-CoA synthetase (AMP-forming)/AMP-acid ligase II
MIVRPGFLALSGSRTGATLAFCGRGRYGAMNPAAWVERHGRRRPDDPALAEGDRVHASWGEFATRTAGAATGLRDHFGLSPGDR